MRKNLLIFIFLMSVGRIHVFAQSMEAKVCIDQLNRIKASYQAMESYKLIGDIIAYDTERKNSVLDQQAYVFYKSGKSFAYQLGPAYTTVDTSMVATMDEESGKIVIHSFEGKPGMWKEMEERFNYIFNNMDLANRKDYSFASYKTGSDEAAIHISRKFTNAVTSSVKYFYAPSTGLVNRLEMEGVEYETQKKYKIVCRFTLTKHGKRKPEGMVLPSDIVSGHGKALKLKASYSSYRLIIQD
jgi:hypothetical protein